MSPAEFTPIAVLALVILRWGGESWLLVLNRRHSLAAAARPVEGGAPDEADDPGVRERTAAYTTAKIAADQMELGWSTVCLLAALLSGALPASLAWVSQRWGHGLGASAAWFLLVSLAFTITEMPLEWRRQFVLEARFGFNSTTARTWWLDQAKGLLLAALLGAPLFLVVLWLFRWAGAGWWWRAWLAVLAFQWVLAWLAPVALIPLFNRLTPLPESPLRSRLLDLCQRAGFPARGIFVMDGSKRTRHANAFFTGFGRFRRIVLFDTLIEQLTPEEVEAVLAHEIGHFKRGHIVRTLSYTAAAAFAAFAALGWLARQPSFTESFGFSPDAGLAPPLLLFGLLSGSVLFWIRPLSNRLSRRHEFQADAYAATAVGRSAPLMSALRKLARHSLSNPNPHPLYSAWHYSHPTLVERERALSAGGAAA